ncbi:electron transfer flavoprotein subunit beta/FixA family protein [Candidatus Omnitrophota bacterium]
MAFKIIVTVKQVPDTQQITGEAMKADGTVNRAALPAIVNPEDLNALEEAIRIKIKYGGHITVISMGPPKASEALKECYYRGADDVILISDAAFAGADTLATSFTLKCAIDKIGGYDLVLCGRQAIDGDTAQVGPQLAEKLKVNQLTFVSQIIGITKGPKKRITVKRSTENGYEILKSALPVLLTVTNSANQPRSPSAKRLLSFKNMVFRKENAPFEETGLDPKYRSASEHFKIWDIESLRTDRSLCGLNGSPTRVKKIKDVVLTSAGTKQISGSDEDISNLIKELREEHIIG